MTLPSTTHDDATQKGEGASGEAVAPGSPHQSGAAKAPEHPPGAAKAPGEVLSQPGAAKAPGSLSGAAKAPETYADTPGAAKAPGEGEHGWSSQAGSSHQFRTLPSKPGASHEPRGRGKRPPVKPTRKEPLPCESDSEEVFSDDIVMNSDDADWHLARVNTDRLLERVSKLEARQEKQWAEYTQTHGQHRVDILRRLDQVETLTNEVVTLQKWKGSIGPTVDWLVDRLNRERAKVSELTQKVATLENLVNSLPVAGDETTPRKVVVEKTVVE